MPDGGQTLHGIDARVDLDHSFWQLLVHALDLVGKGLWEAVTGLEHGRAFVIALLLTGQNHHERGTLRRVVFESDVQFLRVACVVRL